MIAGLQLSPELTLPLDFVTKTCAILAQRRKGKTYTASLIAEELVRCEMPWVALDPTGAWWGLRSGADGNPDGGLPVTILGGAHGDAPLERTSGRHVAELVIDKLARFILDEIPDEPSRPEGAVDTAIRLLRSAHDTTEHVAATEARIRMVHELHTAIYGDSWARPESAKRVWKMLLAKVADLSARSKANGIEIGS